MVAAVAGFACVLQPQRSCSPHTFWHLCGQLIATFLCSFIGNPPLNLPLIISSGHAAYSDSVILSDTSITGPNRNQNPVKSECSGIYFCFNLNLNTVRSWGRQSETSIYRSPRDCWVVNAIRLSLAKIQSAEKIVSITIPVSYFKIQQPYLFPFCSFSFYGLPYDPQDICGFHRRFKKCQILGERNVNENRKPCLCIQVTH